MSRPAGARPVPPRHVSLCILSGPTWRTPGRAVLRKGSLRGFYQVKQCHERPRTRLVRTGGMRVFDAAARFPHSCTIPNCSLGAYVCGRRYVLVEEACKRVPEPAVPARKGPGARVRKRSLPTHKRARALRGARGKFRARNERSGAHVFQTGRYRDRSLLPGMRREVRHGRQGVSRVRGRAARRGKPLLRARLLRCGHAGRPRRPGGTWRPGSPQGPWRSGSVWRACSPRRPEGARALGRARVAAGRAPRRKRRANGFEP